MNADKIVLHSSRGVISKGNSIDFSPYSPSFHISTVERPFDPVTTWIESLKAIFFVKDFYGNSAHRETHDFSRAPMSGKHVIVTFRDQEKMFGTTDSLDRESIGFFLYPVDREANTSKAFVVNSFIESVQTVS